MRSMFEGATNFNKSVDWSMLDALTDTSYMFTDATSFNSTINLDGDIEDMTSMFERATSFNHSSINNL